MDALFQDFRYALRTFAGNPAFAALTTLCLALGIGVNGAIFSLADTVGIRPLPFHDSERLTALYGTRPVDGVDRSTVSYAELRDWRERARSFAAVAGFSRRSFTLTDREESERIPGAAITANLFPTLGIQPVVGRAFTAEDDAPDAPPIALLAHGLWQRKFSGDASVVGRTVVMDGAPRTIVGVMPPRFAFPERADLWVPIGPLEHQSGRGDPGRTITGVARLAPGVSIEAARDDLAGIAAQLASEYREHDGWSATATTLRVELIPEDATLMAFTMLGAVTLVLIIACANVANLLLARSTARQREMAVRTALGAGRGRIVRQLLTESVVIAVASVPIGIALAYAGLALLTAAVPMEEIPYYIDWTMNRRVLAYMGVVALATGVVFGLAPALQAADRRLHHALKDGGRGTATSAARNRTRNILVVAEIALSLVLLVGASLFVRTFVNVRNADLGFEADPLMTGRYYMGGAQYEPEDARIRRTEDIVERIAALPGVESVFASNFVPLNGGGGWSRIVSDAVAPEAGREPEAAYFAVTAGALPTLGVRLLAGRDFRPDEARTRSGVAIVNSTFAAQLFPGVRDVVGRRFRLLGGGNVDREEWLTVVGLTGPMRVWDIRDAEPTPFAFVPYPYMPTPNTGFTIRVAGGRPAAITPAVRSTIREADPMMPLFELRTGEENRALNFWDTRLFGWMFAIFGVVALLLAAIGTYGVLSYSVAQRTQEIGVRMALGAGRRDVFALVLRQAARLALWGVATGIVLSFAVTRITRSFLYNVSATDPISFIGTALFLGIVALLAAYMPARRATAVDPLVALRAE